MRQLRLRPLVISLLLALAAHPGAHGQRPASVPEPTSRSRAESARPITLRAQNATLDSVLTEIARQSGYRIMYSDDVLAYGRPVSVAIADASLPRALELALAGTGLAARFISARAVVVVQGDAPAERPAGVVTGLVVDAATGRPIAGATVRLSRGSTATTGTDGRYVISGVPLGRQVLQAFSLGYVVESRTLSVAASTTADVRLAPNVVRLDELIAIGYGTARRRDLTGAVESVRERELPPEGAPSTSISSSLIGRVAGVQIVTNGGAPGSSASLQIRGAHSISASSEPLYVVDGVPLSPGGSDLTTGTPLSAIDPGNVESLQILKDASATAIFGARGANGVVLITTKRGAPGSNRITLESSYGMQRPTKFIEALNAQEYRALVNEGLVNIGQAVRFTQQQIAGAPSFDYPRALLNDLEWQPQQSYGVTLSGGDGQTRYLVFGSHLDQDGLVVNSGYRRSAARVNLDRTLSTRFRIGLSLSGTRSIQELNGSTNTGSGSNHTGITTAIQYDPGVFPFDSATGTWNQRVVLNDNFLNPYTEAVNRRGSDRISTVLASVLGEVHLREGLILREQLGGNLNFSRSQSFSPRFIASGNNLGTAQQSSGERRELTSSTTLQYRREWGPGTLDALLGADVQTSYFENVTAEARGFPLDQLQWYDLGGGSTPIPPTSASTAWTLLSQLGRINYNLRERYLVTVTARRDGSSRFGANNKWAIFPSAAFAWRLIDEPLLRDQDFISDLKFRLSYGRTGNQAIDPYQSLEQLSTVFVARGTGSDVVTLAPDVSTGNPDLKWETQDQLNVGLDLGVFDNRVSLTLDAYQSNTSNLLLDTQQLWVTGVNTQLRNVGAVRNRGVELGLNTVNWEGDEFAWGTSLNVSRNVNEVTELYGGLRDLGSGSSTQLGEPLNTIVGHKVLGLWQQGDACTLIATNQCTPGEYRIQDTNGDRVINDDDRVNLGSPQADLYGGFTSNMSYGPVTLDAFLNFSVGNEINAQPFMRFLGLVGGASNERRDRALRRWTPQNTDTDVPRANITRPVNPTYSTYVEDASFLRLQTLTLGYEMPTRLIPGAYVEAARMTLTAQNLWIATRYSGFDPESQARDSGGYPRARAWNLGLNLVF